MVEIIVNGKKVEAKKLTQSLNDIVTIVRSSQPIDSAIHNLAPYNFTTTFEKADQEKQEGTLITGQHVKIKKGTVFNCYVTNGA